MKQYLPLGMFVVLLINSRTYAEIRSAFGPCISGASHIVSVQIIDDVGDTFRVIESWHGSLKPEDVVAVPGLGKMASGGMVLFLKKTRNRDDARWKWSGAGSDLRTSVVWVHDNKTFAVQQPVNSGPAYIASLTWWKTLPELKEYVLSYTHDRKLFETAMATKDVAQRVKAFAKIANRKSNYHEEAIEELGKSGPSAMGILRAIVNGDPDHRQKYAIKAFAACGGEKALQELSSKMDREIDYWKRTAPILKTGWWLSANKENKVAWIRYGNLMTLVRTLNEHRHPSAREKTIAIRDFFRHQPVLEDDDRIGKMTNFCEYVLSKYNHHGANR